MGRPTHTQNWQDCVQDVQAKGDGNAYAICTAKLGTSIESREDTLKKHAMAALDDNDGDRGDIMPDDHYPAETPDSQVPGSIKPSVLEQKDGKVVEMNSRCAMCGTAMSVRDAKYGGTKCCECSESAPTPQPGSKTQAQKKTLDISSDTTKADPDSNPQDPGEIDRPKTKGVKSNGVSMDDDVAMDDVDAALDDLAHSMDWATYDQKIKSGASSAGAGRHTPVPTVNRNPGRNTGAPVAHQPVPTTPHAPGRRTGSTPPSPVTPTPVVTPAPGRVGPPVARQPVPTTPHAPGRDTSNPVPRMPVPTVKRTP